MKMKFVAYHDDGSKTIKTINSVYILDALEGFQDFLKGCGYVLRGRLEVIEEEKEDEQYTL